jgi:hypothetical protein
VRCRRNVSGLKQIEREVTGKMKRKRREREEEVKE